MGRFQSSFGLVCVKCWSNTCHEWSCLCCSLECLFEAKAGINEVVLLQPPSIGENFQHKLCGAFAVPDSHAPVSTEKVKTLQWQDMRG